MDDATELHKQAMLLDITEDVRRTADRIGQSHLDPRVMWAMGRVPRHEYVTELSQTLAYQNHPLPIGYGQTISQPYIVALMTDLLNLTTQSRVLEIGTGCGYQTAILAELVRTVYSIEIIEPLALDAKTRLDTRYDNIHLKCDDGYLGWAEHGPYDAIIVTAETEQAPPALIEQLKAGGILVIPLTNRLATQLTVVEKDLQSQINRRPVLAVTFVPLTRKK